LAHLRIGTTLTLPADAIVRTWAILAMRGAGKTYTAGVVVEEILEHRLMPVVVVDPLGA